MNIVTQVLPLALLLIYPAIAIFLLALALRFVRAQERIANALENSVHQLRRQADAAQPPVNR
ncbi:MAG TPA: hypothetical protein VHE61_07090 [Opitutaceae bacterium]|nr:hypothetical protein [Opitutaceae bacterium]